jgi:hypothetical protein
MIEEHYYTESHFLYSKARGRISYSDLIGFIRSICPEKVASKEIRLIFDGTKARYDFGPENVTHAVQELAQMGRKFDRVQVAIVHSTPIETAYAMMVGEDLSLSNYSQKVFCTVEEAKEWFDTNQRHRQH